MVVFEINIPPLSVNHLYENTRTGRRFLKPEGKRYKLIVAATAKPLFPTPLTTPVQMNITYVFHNKRRRDVTNYDKPILDALSGIAYLDDSQITTITLNKLISNIPKTIIKIQPL